MFNISSLSELKVESKVGKLSKNSEEVFNFLTNFNNFSKLIPQDKIKNWIASEDSCSFEIEKVGMIGLEIVEKEPFKLIKIKGSETVPYKFFLWIQLKEIDPNDTRIKLTIKANLNPMIKSVAKKPLQEFVDSLVDQMQKLFI